MDDKTQKIKLEIFLCIKKVSMTVKDKRKHQAEEFVRIFLS